MDVRRYAERAERFTAELGLEHYEHFSGRKRTLDVEEVYERHRELFARGAVETLRELAAGGGDRARGARYLLELALGGHLGLASRAEEAELARREATLELELDGERIAFRQAPVEQANEPDAARRAELEGARQALTAERLNPLYLEMLERSHDLVRELGWTSYAEAFGEAAGIDLEALVAECEAMLRATDSAYESIVAPELRSATGVGLAEAARADLPRLFRAPHLDQGFPPDGLLEALGATLAALGIELQGQRNVTVDAEPRATKSPRAFCSPVRVPADVRLVVPRVGGREDYAALFHEAGHTEHYAHVDPELEFEHRALGDNSVTESFAFLFERLTADPGWLGWRGIGAADAVASHDAAVELLLIRRYCAKLAYELELHGPTPDLATMPARYAELLGGATRVEWPAQSWLADVDGGFYCACYLRAWALESRWRRELRDRHGERWFAQPAAGAWLIDLWRIGQRLPADELLAERLGEELDLGALAGELAPARASS
jgi:hypothetical protein